ncbi:glycosyltransferase family 2 protein [Halpernia sp.]|uniref:glycosyltransferase family 2 protein n=1 Tax=Halpernia sp. TaxID=2782209 RepID=UPI003A95CFD1
MLLTIFTPTYNRSYILPTLYESLIAQKLYNFEWLIVDDGSTDNTRDLVNSWIKNAPFKIKYIFQENQGKHIAINTAVKEAQSELFFIVDSDDFLLEDATEIIALKYKKIINEKDVAGIASSKGHINNDEKFTDDIKNDVICFTSKINYEHKIAGEFAFVYKLEVLKQFPYPQFDGEKFCKESLVYKKIAQKYKMLFIPEVIYKAEYREDGLSANYWKLVLNNPKSSMLFYKLLSTYKIPLKHRLNALSQYWFFYLNQKENRNLIKGFKGVSKTLSLFVLFQKAQKKLIHDFKKNLQQNK